MTFSPLLNLGHIVLPYLCLALRVPIISCRETKQLKLSTQQDGYRIRVKFLYDKDNQTVVGEDHGSHTLLRVDEFELQHPGEYLISVEGGYDDVVDGNKSKFIRMLRFKTNIRTSQLFGLETKPSFKLEKERHKFIEFHGTIDRWPPRQKYPCHVMKTNDWMNNYIGLPPKNDHKAHKSFVSDATHHASKAMAKFELQHPGEYLISVEGGYDDVVDGNKSKFIRMLRFKTNIRTSQLFGLETKPSFKLEKERHKFIEFHGTIGNMLKKIGVHVHYIMLISI
ncbi:jacalin-related lectin 16 [Capsella rubella]|uniref:jacalin-related lectin 16 n=1 Tax=Capsella rubella TaxID=81985 RepID=UPI000CD5528D|nr:jacalin-related lectin 16 [Capsella rubella]